MNKVAQLAPGSGYVDLTLAAAGVGLSSPALTARGELGWRPTVNQSLFAFGEAKAQFGQPLGWSAGVGYRATWP
jgi:hypothetical protein